MRTMLPALAALACCPMAEAQEVGDWWNPSLDPGFRVEWGAPATEAAEKVVEGLKIREVVSLWQFALGTSPDFGNGYQPLWHAYAFAENCRNGIQMNTNLHSEFGDRAQGQAQLNATRERFRAWAGSQPQTLRLYTLGSLGRWSQETGKIGIDPAYHNDRPMFGQLTTQPAILNYADPASWPAFGYRSYSDVSLDLSGSLSSEGKLGVARLPASLGSLKVTCFDSGKSISVDTTLDIKFQFVTQRNGQLYKDFALPMAFDMSRETVQAFIARNPSREVIYEIHVAPIDRSGVFTQGGRKYATYHNDEFTKRVTVKRLIVRDRTGVQLADFTY